MSDNSPSIEKNLEMLSKVAKKSFAFEQGGNVTTYGAPKQVYISQTFFRRFDCQMCGWCCIRATLEYYPFQLDAIKGKQIESNLKKEIFTINGVEKFILKYDQLDHDCRKCKFLKPTTCMIHDQHSFNCRLEPIKMRRRGDKGYLMKTHPGRRWVRREGIQAQCKFFDYSMEQLRDHDLPLLEEMNRIAEYLGIETWLPEIINRLKTGIIGEMKAPVQAILVGENQ